MTYRTLRSVLVSLATFLTAGAISSARGADPLPLAVPPWPATDGLGRALPLPGAVPPSRAYRFVGMFYFLWHDNRRGVRPDGSGPYDVAQILLQDPDAARKPTSPPWGPVGMYHYWSEPLFGYYRSDDRWVIRRHAQLLVAAGVDTLIFDATNAQSYPRAYSALCEVFTQIRQDGGQTPQIAFMVNTKAGQTARQIYDNLYQPGRFRDLWFTWQGRPLLLCDPAEADDEVRAFFTLRRAHWPFKLVNTRDAWHWESTYPQVYGTTGDPEQPEQINVSVAQNLRVQDGKVTNMSSGNARGRSFHDGERDTTPGAVDQGGNFAEQWRRAIELDPPFVLVTGWNEWIAGRWERPGEPLAFVDQYDREYSRDIEPMKGGHGDAYYYQLVANVRRYKGAAPLPPASAPKRIDLGSDPAFWNDVRPQFTDDAGDASPRDHDGVAGTHYVNTSARNDIVSCQVARDATHLFFRALTRHPLTDPTEPGFMTLLIDIDQNPKTGWEGYDFLVQRATNGPGRALFRNQWGWSWEQVAAVPSQIAGESLTLTIPRSQLGLKEGSPVSFDFKWTDNLQKPGDILDFYQSGDVAPEGRFNFRYTAD